MRNSLDICSIPVYIIKQYTTSSSIKANPERSGDAKYKGLVSCLNGLNCFSGFTERQPYCRRFLSEYLCSKAFLFLRHARKELSMSNSPEKGEKQNVGKGEKVKQSRRTETEKTKAEGNPGSSGGCGLERIATDYDQAIRGYEGYYRRQGAYNTGSILYDPYSYYYPP